MQLLILSPTPWSVSDDVFSAVGCTVTRRIVAGGGRPDWNVVTAADVIILALYAPHECAEIASRLRKQEPGATIIPLCPQPDPDFLLRMIRLGVPDVLTNDDPHTITELLRGLTPGVPNSAAPRSHRNLCLGFASGKGGDGATLVMASFAWALAAVPGLRIVVIDVAQPFGDLELHLTDTHPAHDLASFSVEIERLDDALLNTMIGHVSDQIDLIAAPATFDRVLAIAPDRVADIVDRLIDSYDYVLIDLGSLIAPISLSLLEKLDRLMLITRATVASARAASQQLVLLESLEFSPDNVTLVANAAGAGDGISHYELGRATNKSVDVILPDVGKVANAALARGTPVIAIAPHARFAKAMRTWVGALTGLATKEQSLWNRLRNR